MIYASCFLHAHVSILLGIFTDRPPRSGASASVWLLYGFVTRGATTFPGAKLPRGNEWDWLWRGYIGIC